MEMLDLESLAALLEGENDTIANYANSAAFFYDLLDDVSWVGFYRMKQNELLLGPFVGKPACVHLPLGKGVCSKAATTKQTVVVPNVHEFATHIACDAKTNSEIVIPIMHGERCISVLDIDSPSFDRFKESDITFLKKAAEIIAKHVHEI